MRGARLLSGVPKGTLPKPEAVCVICSWRTRIGTVQEIQDTAKGHHIASGHPTYWRGTRAGKEVWGYIK